MRRALVLVGLLLWAARLGAQPAPLVATTLTTTNTSAASACIGCAGTTPAANSGARLATVTLDPNPAPTVVTNKLYNIGGGLFFNGVGLATGSSLVGTAGTLAKFVTPGSVGNSLVTEAGATVTVTGALGVTGAATVGSTLAVTGAVTGASFTGTHTGNGAGLTGLPMSAITSGNYVATVASGTGITSSATNGTAAATTISLTNTAVAPGAYGAGTGATFTVDQQGRLTAAGPATITSVGTITSGTWTAGPVTTTDLTASGTVLLGAVSATSVGAGTLGVMGAITLGGPLTINGAAGGGVTGVCIDTTGLLVRCTTVTASFLNVTVTGTLKLTGGAGTGTRHACLDPAGNLIVGTTTGC